MASRSEAVMSARFPFDDEQRSMETSWMTTGVPSARSATSSSTHSAPCSRPPGKRQWYSRAQWQRRLDAPEPHCVSGRIAALRSSSSHLFRRLLGWDGEIINRSQSVRFPVSRLKGCMAPTRAKTSIFAFSAKSGRPGTVRTTVCWLPPNRTCRWLSPPDRLQQLDRRIETNGRLPAWLTSNVVRAKADHVGPGGQCQGASAVGCPEEIDRDDEVHRR